MNYRKVENLGIIYYVASRSLKLWRFVHVVDLYPSKSDKIGRYRNYAWK